MRIIKCSLDDETATLIDAGGKEINPQGSVESVDVREGFEHMLEAFDRQLGNNHEVVVYDFDTDEFCWSIEQREA